MQVTVEKLSPVLVEFHVRIPVEKVKQSMDRAYDSLARSANIKGFRRGKAPRHVLAHLFGDRVAFDVANKLVEETLSSALQQHNVRPITSPQVEKPKPSPTDDYTYRARFEVTPDIEKVDYEKMELTRPIYPVRDEHINAEIEALRLQHSTLQSPDPARAAKAGDTITMDFALDVDGKPVEAAAGTGVTAEVGSSGLPPEFSQALEGKAVDSVFDVDMVFAEDHQREDFRGKSARFRVTLKDIKERVLPAVDDEFAKDAGPYENLEALRNHVRSEIEKRNKERSEGDVAEAIVVALCEKNRVPVPPSLVQQQARAQEEEVLQQARRHGQTARTLSPELRQHIAIDAEMKVRASLLMAEIAKRHSIKITDEDIKKAYEELAEQTGKNINKIKVQYQDPKQREILMSMIIEDKILNIIEAAATITEEQRDA